MIKRKFLSLVLLLLILTLSFTMLLEPVKAESWLTPWSYRKSHVVNNATGAGTNYQVRIKAWYLNPNLGTWTAKAVLPVSRADLPGCVHNGLLYVFGGYGTSPSDISSEAYSYDPSSNSWTQLTSMTYARWGAAAAAYGSVIYVFGGDDGASNNKVEAYNVSKNSWTTKSNLPANLVSGDGGQMAVAIGSYIYVFLGTYAYRYDPSNDSYTQLASSPVYKRWGCCAYVNVSGDDRVYILSGYDSNNQGTNTVYYYSVTNSVWSSAQAVAPHFAFGVLRDNPVINGKIYYGFGFDGHQTFFNNIYWYDPTANTWSTALTSATYARDGLACGVISNKLYAVGGRNVVSNPPGLNYNEVFDPSGVSDSGENVLLNGHCRTDFADVRFTADDGTTLLSYWLETESDSNYAVFWVKVNADLSTKNQTIYIYYGKSDATTTSNGDNTFLFFDDFLGSSYDTGKWVTVGSPTVSVADSCVTISRSSYSGSWSAHGLETKTFLVDEARILARGKTTSGHPSFTAGHPCSQFTSKGAANNIAFTRNSNIYLDCDGRDEGAGYDFIIPQAYSTNTFYSFYLYRWGTSYAKCYVDGDYKGQVTSNVRDGNRNVAVWLQEWGTYSGTRDVVVDWVAVAKYVDPEPSQGSWGTEEIGKYVMINQAFVSDGRADVGSVQTIGFHAKWNNVSDVVGGSIYLNGTEYVTNSTGWININVYSSKVGKDVWTVIGVNCDGVTDYSQTVQNPSIIWDRIKIVDGGVSKGLLILGEKATVWFKALYEYDNDTFDGANGALYSNGFPMSWSTTNNQWEYDYTATTVGTKTFTISRVSDSSYNLTVVNDSIGAQTLDVWSLPFSVISNSTISELSFNSTSRLLSFTVSGPSGTIGYTNVTIAKTLIANISELKVNLDGNQINYTATSTDYSWLIHFTYEHSTHKVVIILGSQNFESSEETPPGVATIFSVIVIAILTAILLVTKARQRYQSKSNNVMSKRFHQKIMANPKKLSARFGSPRDSSFANEAYLITSLH